MYPTLFQWGDLVVPSWHFFYCLAAVLSYFVWENLRKTKDPDIEQRTLTNVYLVCYLGAYIGARGLSEVIEALLIPRIHEQQTSLWIGSMTFYGGMFGAIACGIIYAVLCKHSVQRLFDGGVLAGLFALGVGRIGCFLNGDDYGIPADLSQGIPWWSVIFKNHSIPIPRVPIQLIESLGVFLLVLLIRIFFSFIRKIWGAGRAGLLGLIGYSSLRFVIEFYRDDERGSLADYSTSQVISFVLLALTLAVWIQTSTSQSSHSTSKARVD